MRTRTASKCAAAGPVPKPVALAVALALAAPAAWAAPTGATVVAGQVQITQADAQSMLIKQGSDKAIVNWRGFSIAAGESVQFQQPNSGSVALNRVTSSAPSEIFGRLSANGKVFLVNSNGVMFGKSASVDVGGLVASTLKIADDDFLAGRYQFTDGAGAGAVRNEGAIAAAERGTIALLGAQVSNQGTITARLGTVGLAAGGKVSLDFNGDGLTRIVVDAARINALVENGGAVIADGGQVTMTARALDALAGTVLRQNGIVRANALVERNGRIILDGGSVGQVDVAGTVDATGREAGRRGGDVTVLGHDLSLAGQAAIDVRGDAGGGTVLVGGDYRGANSLVPHAASTTMAPGATIRADAINSGDGGKVILWSDGNTSALGSLSAKGGASGGDGGLAETSGKTVDVAGMRVNASSPHGKPGTWLLDPVDVIIDAPLAATISAALSTGTNHEESTSNNQFQDRGDIHVNANILKSAGGDAKLTLSSDHDIIVAPNVQIASTAGKLDVDFNANYHIDPPGSQVSAGGILMNPGSAILTNGGNIQFYGRSDPNNYAAADSVLRDGIVLNQATLDTRVGQADNGGGGSVTLRGAGDLGNGDPEVNGARGIAVIESSIVTASGDITMNAIGGQGVLPDPGNSVPAGVGGIGIQIQLSGTVKLATTSGTISLFGTDGSGWHVQGTQAHSLGSRGVQVDLAGQAAITTATDGAISINGSSYGAGGTGVAITTAGNATISAGNLFISGTSSEDAGVGLSITGAAQGTTIGGGAVQLTGIGAQAAGLVLKDVTANTVAGAGRVVLAGETAADAPGLSLDHVTLGNPGMLGDVLIRARNASGSSKTISYGAGSQIQTAGVINIRPGGADPGSVADTLIPIDVGAGSNQFQVLLASLGLAGAGAGGGRIVIGSATHTGAINYLESAALPGDLTLQNGGAGSNGIAIDSNMNVSGLVTLSSGGEVRAAAAAINAGSLLLHGSQPESNFQLTNAANSVGRFAATFDSPKGAGSPAYGDVNFVNSGALSIAPMSGNGYSSTTNAATTIDATNTVVAGDLLLRAGGNLTLGANVSTLGSTITLVTAGTFQNPSNGQLLPGGGDTWRVFADTWVGETRSALAPSQPHPNYYNCAYGAPCSDGIAGNHFFYRAQPTVVLQATNLARGYGDANPPLTYTQSGVVNGDTVADALSGGYATTALTTSPVGAYPITGSFTSPVGYLIDARPGTLNIDKAVLTYVANPSVQFQGVPAQPIGGTVTGFVHNDTLADATTGTLAFTSPATPTSPTGTYAVQGLGLAAANYRFVQAASNETALTMMPTPLNERPTILKDLTFESSKVYEKNFGSPRLCVGTGPLAAGSVASESNDPLALEWSRVRISPNLSNCLGLGQRNSCSDF